MVFKNKVVGVVLAILVAKALVAKNDSFECNKLDSMSARSLRSALVNAGIVVFAKDNLIKSGISPVELETWNTQISCYNDFALEDLKKRSAEEKTFCSSCINELNAINRYVQTTIKDLKKNYSSVYKNGSLVFKQLLRQGALKNLPKIEKEVTEKLATVHEIASNTLSHILNTTPLTSRWKNSVKADPNLILQNYKNVLKSYSSQKVAAFIKKYANNADDAQLLLSKLEKLIYRLNEKKLTSTNLKEKKELSALIERASGLIADLRKAYPLALTEGDIDKVDASSDKIAAILLGETDAFSGILSNLLKNVKELLASAKK